jgi:hypothetical protein
LAVSFVICERDDVGMKGRVRPVSFSRFEMHFLHGRTADAQDPHRHLRLTNAQMF